VSRTASLPYRPIARESTFPAVDRPKVSPAVGPPGGRSSGLPSVKNRSIRPSRSDVSRRRRASSSGALNSVWSVYGSDRMSSAVRTTRGGSCSESPNAMTDIRSVDPRTSPSTTNAPSTAARSGSFGG
jgi:hypothetical protein